MTNFSRSLRFLGLMTARDHLIQRFAGNRTGGDPHVPDVSRLGRQALHLGPLGGDLGHALDHVQRTFFRHDRDGPAAPFVPGLHPHDRSQPGDMKARHRNFLRNLNLDRRDRLLVVPLLVVQHLILGDERPRQVVVDHQDRLGGRSVARLGLERVLGQARDVGQAAGQNAAVAHHQGVGPRRAGPTRAGPTRAGNGRRQQQSQPTLESTLASARARWSNAVHDPTPLVPDRADATPAPGGIPGAAKAGERQVLIHFDAAGGEVNAAPLGPEAPWPVPGPQRGPQRPEPGVELRRFSRSCGPLTLAEVVAHNSPWKQGHRGGRTMPRRI